MSNWLWRSPEASLAKKHLFFLNVLREGQIKRSLGSEAEQGAFWQAIGPLVRTDVSTHRDTQASLLSTGLSISWNRDGRKTVDLNEAIGLVEVREWW